MKKIKIVNLGRNRQTKCHFKICLLSFALLFILIFLSVKFNIAVYCVCFFTDLIDIAFIMISRLKEVVQQI